MFCYVVGNSIKTLLAGKLHFLWRMGLGHPSRAGIWGSGLAARFITSRPPASVPLNLAGRGETKQCHRNCCFPHTSIPTTLPSLELLPQELAEPPRSCCMPAPAPTGFGAAQGILARQGPEKLCDGQLSHCQG